MWFLPTFNRPQSLATVIEACRATGMSTPCIVLVQGTQMLAEYQALELPENWQLHVLPENIGLLPALNYAFKTWPNEPWYGQLVDDNLPRTQGWDARLVEAAGERRFVTCKDLWQAPPRAGGAVVFGGDILRALGFWALPGLWHCYCDDFWETMGRETGLWSIVEDVVVETIHPWKDGKPGDATLMAAYGNGGARMREDEHVFRSWMQTGRAGTYAALRHLIAQGDNSVAFVADLTGIRVAIATPAYGGLVTTKYAQSLAMTLSALHEHGVNYDLMTIDDESMIHRARNHLVDSFLKGPCSHLMFIDADMGWDAFAVLRLLASGKDIAGGAGPRKQLPLSFCCNMIEPVIRCPKTGLMRAHQLGSGFLMVTRRALESMIAQASQAQYYDALRETWVYALFHPEVSNYCAWSEDYAFCNRATKNGLEVWVDPTIRLDHVGRQTFTGALQDTMIKTPKPVDSSPLPLAAAAD